MANFAIAADENVIARGNKLIEELQEPGEKKGVTLNRLFDLVSTHLQEDQLKRSGVDTEALDASICLLLPSPAKKKSELNMNAVWQNFVKAKKN